MNIWDIVFALLLVIALVFAVRSAIIKKKQGKCCGGCAGCSGDCSCCNAK